VGVAKGETNMPEYDVITVGGGLAGSALGKSLGEGGMKVLVLERETVFKDRVRGEQMHPWGVAELRQLGLYGMLLQTCGHELPWWDMFLWPQQIAHRDLTVTTPQGAPEFSFYHPAMQEVLVQVAENAGAKVRRGVHVSGVEPGSTPRVLLETDRGKTEAVNGRLVVGCDGRRSMVRQWAVFKVHHDPPGQCIAGLLFEDSRAPTEDTSHVVLNSQLGREVALFPQGRGRLRAYLICQSSEETRFQAEKDIPRFIEESVKTGAPAECYEGAMPHGPLATFDCADTWVSHPYRDGVALVGDAAASNDPSYGEGLSLTVRDVRVLRDHLLRGADFDRAGQAYAEEHDHYYGVIHDVTRWFTQMFLEQGPAAEARRARALPLIAQDQTRIPDHMFSGPELPFDETVRQRFFGED
jgi:2-polyprenyl-6-methoxyphenol hydroxylase-like FAD-dependent oxidoreductase